MNKIKITDWVMFSGLSQITFFATNQNEKSRSMSATSLCSAGDITGENVTFRTDCQGEKGKVDI